jgi:VWFA-related protein
MSTKRLLVLALSAATLGSAHPSQDARPSPAAFVAAVARPAIIETLQVLPWNLVGHLAPEDFEVVCDGQPRPVQSVSIDARPLSLVVLIDVSASAELDLGWLPEPLNKGIGAGLKPGDRVAFGRFGGVGVHLGPFVSGTAALAGAARQVLTRPRREDVLAPPAEPSPLPPGVVPARMDPSIAVAPNNGAYGLGGSPAWDAVDAAVTTLALEAGRKAIVLITDGRSNANMRSLDEVIQHAVAAGVAVCAMGEADEEETIRQAGSTGARVRPAVFLETMAHETGGAYSPIFGPEPARPRRSDGDAVKRWIARMLTRLLEDLHGEYVLGFDAPARDGEWHTLEIRVPKHPNWQVHAPRAYVGK